MKLIAPIVLGLVCVVAMAFADYDSYGSSYGGNVGGYGGDYGYGSYGYVGTPQKSGSGIAMWLPIFGLLLLLPLIFQRGPNTIQLVNQSG